MAAVAHLDPRCGQPAFPGGPDLDISPGFCGMQHGFLVLRFAAGDGDASGLVGHVGRDLPADLPYPRGAAVDGLSHAPGQENRVETALQFDPGCADVRFRTVFAGDPVKSRPWR
jgi:hypothetical protein